MLFAAYLRIGVITWHFLSLFLSSVIGHVVLLVVLTILVQFMERSSLLHLWESISIFTCPKRSSKCRLCKTASLADEYFLHKALLKNYILFGYNKCSKFNLSRKSTIQQGQFYYGMELEGGSVLKLPKTSKIFSSFVMWTA